MATKIITHTTPSALLKDLACSSVRAESGESNGEKTTAAITHSGVITSTMHCGLAAWERE